jgi:hypothetical protein
MGLENLQLDVWWDPAGLNGGYVRADYFGLRMLIGKVTEQSVKNMIPSGRTPTSPKFLFIVPVSLSFMPKAWFHTCSSADIKHSLDKVRYVVLYEGPKLTLISSFNGAK